MNHAVAHGLLAIDIHRLAKAVHGAGDDITQLGHEALRRGVPAGAGHGDQLALALGVYVGGGFKVDLAGPAVHHEPQLAVEILQHRLDHAQSLLHQQVHLQHVLLVQLGLPREVLRGIAGRRHALGVAVHRELVGYHLCIASQVVLARHPGTGFKGLKAALFHTLRHFLYFII